MGTGSVIHSLTVVFALLAVPLVQVALRPNVHLCCLCCWLSAGQAGLTGGA